MIQSGLFHPAIGGIGIHHQDEADNESAEHQPAMRHHLRINTAGSGHETPESAENADQPDQKSVQAG